MKEHLRELVRTEPLLHNPLAREYLVREYLQAAILASLQRSGAMVCLAFHGGTALRFLHQARRFSEDLDFALERPGARFDLHRFAEAVVSDLDREGYTVGFAKVSDRKPVHSTFVKFPGLLHDLGLSPHANQALSVKIEVDTRPPEGAGVATTLVRRHQRLLHLQHHDPASLMAGKLHAVLARAYPKGRDFYDLLCYLSDPAWPAPNLTLLNNALRQTGWTRRPLPLTEASWRGAVRARVRSVDLAALAAEVRRFLEDPGEAALLTRETLVRLLGRGLRSLPTPGALRGPDRRRGGH